MGQRSRRYDSANRRRAAEERRDGVLAAARKLFARRGIDQVTIADIAEAAGVAPSTIYAVYKSKEGILRALMRAALFGARFQAVQSLLQGMDDPVELIARSAQIARAIYEAESTELGLMRGSSAFSPALRKLEREFEKVRFDMQEERVRRLFESGNAKEGLTLDDARRILWMYTSRDIYRMLVHEGSWSPERYQEWLAQTLLATLVTDRRTAR